ncbi:MAG: SdiA-regulated/phytase-like domain-containing protein [Planctomycetota bacterium]|jgi:hypothetical protein
MNLFVCWVIAWTLTFSSFLVTSTPDPTATGIAAGEPAGAATAAEMHRRAGRAEGDDDDDDGSSGDDDDDDSSDDDGSDDGFVVASILSDLSGLAWVGGDRFLAVHDAKNPDELDRPRVGIIELPVDLDGVLWKPLDVRWPGEPSSDLESAARIPGTDHVLLVESGDDGDPFFHRIFRAGLYGDHLAIEAVTDWPEDVFNVEGTAVARLGDTYVFLYAERAQNEPSTDVRWAAFDPQTLTFGPFSSARFRNPSDAYNRPLVAFDVDDAGHLYIASAFDAEAANLPDPDNGPFGSAVWRIGVIQLNDGGEPVVMLDRQPHLVATLDGFKVESVAIHPQRTRATSLFVGTDDENYGATIRPLLPASD